MGVIRSPRIRTRPGSPSSKDLQPNPRHLLGFNKLGMEPEQITAEAINTSIKGYGYFQPYLDPETNSKFAPENGWLEY